MTFLVKDKVSDSNRVLRVEVMKQAEGYGQPVQLVKTAGGREVADIYKTYLTKLLKAAR